jgi:hypothetical protein
VSPDTPTIDGTWIYVYSPDGQRRPVEITSFLQRERHRLSFKHYEFIDAMVSRWKLPFTTTQEKYLQVLVDKLEGRATTNWPWE